MKSYVMGMFALLSYQALLIMVSFIMLLIFGGLFQLTNGRWIFLNIVVSVFIAAGTAAFLSSFWLKWGLPWSKEELLKLLIAFTIAEVALDFVFYRGAGSMSVTVLAGVIKLAAIYLSYKSGWLEAKQLPIVNVS